MASQRWCDYGVSMGRRPSTMVSIGAVLVSLQAVSGLSGGRLVPCFGGPPRGPASQLPSRAAKACSLPRSIPAERRQAAATRKGEFVSVARLVVVFDSLSLGGSHPHGPVVKHAFAAHLIRKPSVYPQWAAKAWHTPVKSARRLFSLSGHATKCHEAQVGRPGRFRHFFGGRMCWRRTC